MKRSALYLTLLAFAISVWPLHPAAQGEALSVSAVTDDGAQQSTAAPADAQGVMAQAEALSVTVGGASIGTVVQLSIDDAIDFFGSLPVQGWKKKGKAPRRATPSSWHWIGLDVPVATTSGAVVVTGNPGIVGIPTRGPKPSDMPAEKYDPEFSAASKTAIERFFDAYAALAEWLDQSRSCGPSSTISMVSRCASSSSCRRSASTGGWSKAAGMLTTAG